jgi:hypothetical protein
MKWCLVRIIIFLLSLAPIAFSAQYRLKAVRIEQGPRIDGYLNDDVWKQAIPLTDFKMVEPNPNSEPTEKTELRVLYDQNNLYIGVYCYDREIAKISANSMAHDDMADDEHGRNNDVVKILLDPFQDKRNAYVFFVNPRGARSEGLAFGEHFSLNWDGVWDAKSRILNNGWSAEIKIPLKTISFNPKLTAWGLNVERSIPRKMETIRLSGTNRDNFFFNPTEAASLEGIQNLKQGLGITFRPYGKADAHKDYELGTDKGTQADGGFDIYKNFTPNFVGAFSYNTDFAETEVDERRINLTRFPLFFPEKRTFFLEGSEIFNFGTSTGMEETFVPFFSRTIGLYKGRQVPVSFGTKFYGKLGSSNLSILDVKTKPFLTLPGENFIAARVYQNILSESKVGFLFTDGNPSGKGRNSLFGLDFNYVTSKFQGDKNFSAGGWLAYNWNKIKRGKHQGYGFRIDYPNDLWDASLTYNYFGDSLNPGLGFLARNNIQYFRTGLSFQPRPEKGLLGSLVRQFFFEFETEFYWDLSGRLETRQIFTSPLNLMTQSGEHIEFNVIPNRDVLPYDFEVARNVVIPASLYNFTNYRFEFNSASYRPIQFDLGYRFGGFYSGHYQDVEMGLGLKYKGYVTLTLNSNFVRGDLPQGKFNENVYKLKADFYFSPNLCLMNYIQYDDVSRQLGVNIRFRWQVAPGNEIYFVYTKNWEKTWDPVSRFIPLEEWGVFKIQLTIRP